MADEEIILRYFSFLIQGVKSYRTPLKNWLNETAKLGRKYSNLEVDVFRSKWNNAIEVCLIWFDEKSCFRRPGGKAINRALFDLIMQTASKATVLSATDLKSAFTDKFQAMLKDAEFQDLISRSVDHKRRTDRRFEIWNNEMQKIGL